MLKIFPFSYGLIVKQGQHYYHIYSRSYSNRHCSTDRCVVHMYMLVAHHVYSSNQCPPPTVYDSGAVFSPTVLDISDDDLIRHFTEVWQQELVVTY